MKSLDDLLIYVDARRKEALTFVSVPGSAKDIKDNTIVILNDCIETLLTYFKQQQKLKINEKSGTDISEFQGWPLPGPIHQSTTEVGEGSSDSDVPC